MMWHAEAEGAARAAERTVAVLSAAGFKVAIGGALAFGIWGPSRGTKDADINVFAREGEHGHVLEAVVAGGFSPDGGRAEWTPADRERFLSRARDGDVVIVWDRDVRVDLFFPSIPFYDEAERTIRLIPHPDGRQIPVLSAEATCVFKLLFFRDKDLVDLRRLVAEQKSKLDTAYVRRQMVDMVGEDDDRIREWDRIVSLHGH